MIETMFFTIVKDKTGYLPTPIIGLTLQGIGVASLVAASALYPSGVINGVIANSLLLGSSVLLMIGSICTVGYFNSNNSGDNRTARTNKVDSDTSGGSSIFFLIAICCGLALGYGASIEGLLHGVPDFATHSSYDILIAGALSFALSLVVSVAIQAWSQNKVADHLVCSVPTTVGLTAGAVASEIVRYYLAEGVPPELLTAATTLVYAGVAAFFVATLFHIMDKYVYRYPNGVTEEHHH